MGYEGLSCKSLVEKLFSKSMPKLTHPAYTKPILFKSSFKTEKTSIGIHKDRHTVCRTVRSIADIPERIQTRSRYHGCPLEPANDADKRRIEMKVPSKAASASNESKIISKAIIKKLFRRVAA
jgi:hypothetical protein